MKKRTQNINNNKKKEKPSYVKMYKEQIKKESEHNNVNKSHMSNNKNEHNAENQVNKVEKQEIKHTGGINFDNLSDWDNIVYPGDKEIKQIINEAQNNNNFQNMQNNENNNDNNYNMNNLNDNNNMISKII